MRRTRTTLVGLVLLTAAGLGESLAFIGDLVGSFNLVLTGIAIVIAPILVVIAKLLLAPRDATNTMERFDRALLSDADGPER